jgi:integrase/recombinase XerD
VGNVFDKAGAVREQFVLSAEQSKGGKTRTVYLSQRLRKAFGEYGAIKNISDPQRPLFDGQKGGHFSANTMCQLFLEIYKACGLKDASSHSGRRTYIIRLANKGVGVRLLSQFAGHSQQTHNATLHRRERGAVG